MRGIGVLNNMTGSVGSNRSDSRVGGYGSDSRVAGHRADMRVGGDRVDGRVGGYRSNSVDTSNMGNRSIGGNRETSGVDSSGLSITLSNAVDSIVGNRRYNMVGRVGSNRSDSRVGSNRADSRVGRNRSDSRVGSNRSDSRVGGYRSDSRVGGYRADMRVGGDRVDGRVGGHGSNSVDSSNMGNRSIGGDRDTSSVDSSGLSISISITLSNGVDNRGSIDSVEAGVGSESSEERRAVGGGVGSIVQRSSSVHNLRFRLSEGNSGQSENSKHLHVESV